MMSEFKGSLTPWVYDKADGEVYSPKSYTSVAIALGAGEGVADANGLLIAAAPELLHVANLICTFFDIMEDGPDDSDKEMAHEIFIGAVQKARAAIAKATGAA